MSARRSVSPGPKRLKAAEDNGHHESVAGFVTKLWHILNTPKYSKLISWSDDGNTFVVMNSNKFAKDVLPEFFKHSNFNSFVRQLNLYGFRKMARPEYGSLSRSHVDDEEKFEFWHTHFHLHTPERLHLVQRRVAHKAEGEVDKNPHRLSAVMSDIHLMKGRQEGIATVLETLKQDNTHLRHEINVLKDKHVRQQKILNKIIHFLVHMVYKGKIPASSRRANRSSGSRLMLMDPSDVNPPAQKKIRIEPDVIEELSAFSDLPSPVELPGFAPLSPASSFLTPPTTTLLASNIPVAVSSPAISSLPPPPSSSPSSSTLPSSTLPSSTLPSSPSTVTTDFQVTSPTDTITSSTTPATPPSVPVSMPAPQVTFPTSPMPPSKQRSGTPAPEVYPPIPGEIQIPPAPSSLVPVPHPENRMCIQGQLQHQQLGLDNLPEFLSGHLCLDPTIVSDFVTSESHLPDYDFNDTARLLESLGNPEEQEALLNAVVPAMGGGVAMADPYLLEPATTSE